MRVGYACVCLGREDLSCKRTTVLRLATPERLRGLIEGNLSGLEEILRFNEERGYRLFRIGNELIPFGSHPVNQIPWWREFAPRFRALGRWIREYGHRISFHASHFTILNSEREEVVRSAVADVVCSARVLEAMELGPEHPVVLHVGISRPGHAEAEARFEAALELLPDAARRHLVLENDDRYFPLDRVVPLCRRTGLPAVVDLLHHRCLPGEWGDLPWPELLERAFSTWRAGRRPPKIHFSSQDPQKRPGAHAYGIDGEELQAFLWQSRRVASDFDIMFEAKGKDLAVDAVLPVLRADPRCEAGAPAGARHAA